MRIKFPQFVLEKNFLITANNIYMKGGNLQGILFTAVGVAVGVVLATMVQKKLMKGSSTTEA